ncbi:TetR/AcrR family transcriptional regulator [Gryllotalpicola reticulitermitis]|uniref:TetR/AcrR family transcriptional regulator n=1 Tax=Gryllotalpicola reticulitermitis TaxID=1184153 RepID=A0ABV8Q970_9MICO
MRADAEANRRRVLDAAEEVFVEQGTDASTEEVARRAGVGVGTVFRHFPTKRDLVESALLSRFDELTAQAQAAESEPDATTALFNLIATLVEHVPGKLALGHYLFGAERWSGPAKQASIELGAVIERALRRAQESGGVRDDIDVDELVFLIRGLAEPRMPGPTPDAARQRARQVVFDGLRRPHRPPIAP